MADVFVEQQNNAAIEGRIPPQNVEAEQSVLGAMLLDNDIISSVTAHITAKDFYRKDHAVIYETMIEMYNDSITIDIITLSEKLSAAGKLEQVGGTVYLSDLADHVPTTVNAERYAKIVEEKALLRSLIKASSGIMDKSYDATDEAMAVMEYAEKEIYDIMSGRERSDFAPVSDVVLSTVSHLEELYKNKGKLSGVTTGFTALDRAFSGLQNSDLILLAARPAMGKTALALNMALNAATIGKVPTAIFSLEMSKEQLVSRLLASQGLIEGMKMRDGSLDDEDWIKLSNAISVLSEAPIYIDDTPSIKVTDIRSKCRKLKMEQGLGLIVIDYLQLMESTSKEGRQAQVAEITRSLKILAKELNVPVVTLSQLSRKAEERNRPMLQDLRESGSIEQDADVVMFIYRDDYYHPETEEKGVAEIIIAKNRHGEVGTQKLGWIPQYTKFMNIDYKR